MVEKRRRQTGAEVPIAKRMQQSADLPFVVAKKESDDDLEDKIKALEAQLNSSSSDDDSSDDSVNDDENDDEAKRTHDGPAILSLSAYQNEKVPALPSELLPKAQAFQSNRRINTSQTEVAPPPKIVGKVPFACKPCGFVGKDLDDFQTHKASDAHNDVVGTTTQRTSCKLCAKDFTSAEQLAEHKLGKWHLMRKRTKKEHFHEAVRVCYDFMRGTCFRGDMCSFSHDNKNSKPHQAIKKPTRPCNQFKTGTCKFGDNCIFLHTTAK
ncbi:hypothetical protein H310_04182 [Aphanomyces invadans]|uniref:C3H1-type domain-containing protein n=1 Tax=Aphanomyces invadans TaxID=157072 RepID=A0A024UHT4_9STRA|nr:hypothetical protein H310_04182 [Aphanomyces invadans]ETW05188.1 hypothetical protein H310_04182 [Aphanomyces invadans]RHY31941.1 hypothetical protein DYB32_003012 [Aphanomyces invadans]|eukprot:XP_008866626.1 hypothetical protein H310_04182 [Aphanomyces invadans]